MISKDAIARGYNHGDYVVGAPTPPAYARSMTEIGKTAGLARDPVIVPKPVLAQLEAIADRVQTAREDIVTQTRDWWSGTRISETSGRPAVTEGAFVRVSRVEQVQEIMKLAFAHAIPVTASAGRSNVTGAALPLRGGIILDLCGLNRFIGFDAGSQLAEVEAGIFGDVFETVLQREHGVTMGHWPSSFGISTVGGWIACRGAGQLSTRYGKIEDMVHTLDVVLADGRLVTLGGYPRAATGPDLKQIFIGSEGTLGIIVRARLRTHRLPDHASALCFGFQSFAAGLEACRRIMQAGATPAVLRLYDALESGIQFDRPGTNVLLIADEGPEPIVSTCLELCRSICEEEGETLPAEAIFERWLDTRYATEKPAEGFTQTSGFVADTLEMAGSWGCLPQIYDEVVAAINEVPGTLAGSAHQSHAYLEGACVYFSLRADIPPAHREEWYRTVWKSVNDVLLRYRRDVTISHHHGVGLLRGPYMEPALGEGFEVLRTIKKALDPRNILNPGKMGFSLS
ncbi:FAD-binding oxidoreductase [Swaminathania salitolerans]|uniref:Alkyldihydroxyacetonephosphate synthase n=1 Tax=Swaminathania salitolerans TaxID=182838 RepID=A0A511BQ52_9PROT|nr:FAD-binding oxidoreductase [Swaminathania salitolerans]GBQ13705.1 putative oxidoreductase [Swaminathania salitolerans LMG 21291]GEL01764.1 alkyldihydroxyacetonephosphate synthase [Swaminathania salitolerans]